MSHNRLRYLIQRGDRAAARRLASEGRRGDDAALLLDAAIVLGDRSLCAELLAAHWTQATGERAAAALGLDLDTAARVRISAMLEFANARAEDRTLGIAELVHAILDAAENALGIAWSHGGEAKWGTDTWSALCLVVRDPRNGAITVALTEAPARGVSPGRAWPELQPWSRKHPARNGVRALAWARDAANDRVRIARREPLATPRCPGASTSAPDTTDVLDALIEVPSEASWRSIVDHIDALEHPGDALAHVTEALEAWPDALRTQWPAWLERRASGAPPGPADDLVRAVSLRDVRAGQRGALWSPRALRGVTEFESWADAALLARRRALAPLRRATLYGDGITLEAIGALLRDPTLDQMRELALLHFRPIPGTPIEALRKRLADYCLGLDSLVLSGDLTHCLAALCASPAIATLRTLDLRRATLAADDFDAALDHGQLGALEELALTRAVASPKRASLVEPLARRAARVPRLRRLDLSGLLRETPSAFATLVASALIERLDWLDLSHTGNMVDDAGLAALAERDLGRVRHLHLIGTAASAAGVARLLASASFHPRTLALGLPLGVRGARAIAAWPGLAGVERLDLTAAHFGGKSGRAAIEASPHLRAHTVIRGIPALEAARTAAHTD